MRRDVSHMRQYEFNLAERTSDIIICGKSVRNTERTDRDEAPTALYEQPNCLLVAAR